MKANPWGLIRAHYRTLVDYSTGERRKRDYFLFLGLPAVVFGVGCGLKVSLPGSASAGLLTTAGLLSAFFFGVMIQITEQALGWANQTPPPPQGRDTTWQAEFLAEITANAGYASLVSILTAAVFVVSAVTTGTPLTIASALGLALAVHLVLLLSMVLNRVYAVTREKLTDVSTGHSASVTAIPQRKTGSGV
jgi:hypothetical protein